MAYGGSRFRWRTTENGSLSAYPSSQEYEVVADPISGTVHLAFEQDGKAVTIPLKAHAAHALGVRLIEAAVLADGNRSIRMERPTQKESPDA